jgi:pyruvate formate lyase activating enzyme
MLMSSLRFDFRPAAWLGLVLLATAAWGAGWPGAALQKICVNPDPTVHAAWYWTSRCHGVSCDLCPRHCYLPEGAKGWCRVRVNAGGRFYTLAYGRAAAVHIDPIEKKPVFHLLPGSTAFSLATAGCNLACDFCQNWSLSQADPETLPSQRLLPAEIVAAAKESGCRSIAYTYSEPTVFYEYMAETARLARQAGLYNIMISAGYIEPEPMRRLLPYLDVVKIDLKGSDPDYYERVVGGRLEPVLKTLQTVAAAGVQLEVVNLVVPGQNSSPEAVRALSQWVRTQLGADTPLFFSRFIPCFRMPDTPITSVDELHAARAIARSEGLRYVYTGNVTGDEGESTFCPTCGRVLVQRFGYTILANVIHHGRCPQCGTKIPGIWDDFRLGRE